MNLRSHDSTAVLLSLLPSFCKFAWEHPCIISASVGSALGYHTSLSWRVLEEGRHSPPLHSSRVGETMEGSFQACHLSSSRSKVHRGRVAALEHQSRQEQATASGETSCSCLDRAEQASSLLLGSQGRQTMASL